MAITVIRTKDPSCKKEKMCRNCGSVLEYFPVDVLSKDFKDYDGGNDTRYWIVCPTCNQKVDVKGI